MNRISRSTPEEAKALDASRKRAVQHHRDSTTRAERNLFQKTAAQHKLDQRVRTEYTKHGIVNERDIQDGQDKTHAILKAGGRVLPPPKPLGVPRNNAAYLRALRSANSPKR